MSFISKLIGGKAGDIISSVAGVVDKFVQTADEKAAMRQAITTEINRNIEELGKQAQIEADAYLKDMADARSREIQITTSDKVPVLNKVITPILALIVVVSTFGIWG